MNKFTALLLVMFITTTAFAKDVYHKAEITYKDGRTITAKAKMVGTYSKYLVLQGSNGEEESKIESEKLSKVKYFLEKDEWEYHFLKVYRGWAQKRTKGPMWLEVVRLGTANLYVVHSQLQSGGNSFSAATFHDYYCIREGEPAAKLVSAVSSMNNNQTFRAKAALYFADHPDLSKKIKSKEYKWKDLETVVDIYNEWAAGNKQ